MQGYNNDMTQKEINELNAEMIELEMMELLGEDPLTSEERERLSYLRALLRKDDN